MTADRAPPNPNVLNTTVLSNFAYVGRVGLLADLAGICTVPYVREELLDGVDGHPFLQAAIDCLSVTIPVVPVSAVVAQRERSASVHLDAGEAQAFALAAANDGRLLTDDGDPRAFAKEHGVPVVGSVGVLLAAIDAEKITEQAANEWLSIWVDEIGYYVPYRTIEEYR